MQNSNGFGAQSPLAAQRGRESQPRGRAWRIVGRVTLVLVSLLGFCGLFGAASEMRVAALPVTPLKPLAQAPSLSLDNPQPPPIEDKSVVRVEGYLRGEPPLQAANGGLFALQKLHVTHIGRRVFASRTSSTRYTDALEQKTPRLWLCVDQQPSSRERVEVQLPRLWAGDQLLISSIVGRVGDAGTIPNNVFEKLALQPAQPVAGQEWELWTIPQNARVTMVAQARLDTGRVLLQIEPGLGCALSPDPWQQITAGTRRAALGQLFLGVLCLLPLAWKSWKRIRGRRAAST